MRAPDWDVNVNADGRIMATRDSGTIGMPWVVMAAKYSRGLRVSLYRPGEDINVEGDVLGELSGNPREMGRQLRDLLGDVDVS
ncbi:MAG: hypothetical protein WCJ82_04510 [Actinomycetota bacterium]